MESTPAGPSNGYFKLSQPLNVACVGPTTFNRPFTPSFDKDMHVYARDDNYHAVYAAHFNVIILFYTLPEYGNGI